MEQGLCARLVVFHSGEDSSPKLASVELANERPYNSHVIQASNGAYVETAARFQYLTTVDVIQDRPMMAAQKNDKS